MRVLRGVKFTMPAIWRRMMTPRCVVCRALLEGPTCRAYNVILSPAARIRLRCDVVTTCGSYYCRDRADRGAIRIHH